MSGPYSSDHRLGADGPPFTDTHPSEPIPTPPAYGPQGGTGDAAPPSAAYPGPHAATTALPETPPSTAVRRRGGGAAADRGS